MKAKIWGASMTSEIDGNVAGVIELAFWEVPAAARPALLEKLAVTHAKLIEQEAKAAAETPGAQSA